MMTQQENDELMYASPEDQAFYLKCVAGLPTLAGLDGSGKGSDGLPLPYGTGPHSVRCLREIVEIVLPKNILEIGFNMGWSSAMWLELQKDARVVSCDISLKEETKIAAGYLRDKFGARFLYFDRYEKRFNQYDPRLDSLIIFPYDLIFIDGGHLYDNVKEDIEWALELNIRYLAFDDILERFGPGVMPAIREYPQLELVKEMGNIALYKNKSV